MYRSVVPALDAAMFACSPAVAQEAGKPATTAANEAPNYAAALAGNHRSAENRARDKYRHPAETLSFFGLQPDMTVVENWPGGGWYRSEERRVGQECVRTGRF